MNIIPSTGGLFTHALKVVFGNVDMMIIILGFAVTMALLLTVDVINKRTN